jgi:hypothetical protein
MPSQTFTAAGQFVDININTKKILAVQVAGNFEAVIAFRVSVDNTNFANLAMSSAIDLTDLKIVVTSIPGVFKTNVEGFKKVRFICVTFVIGPVEVTWETD